MTSAMSVVPVHPLPPRAARTSEPLFRLTVDQYHELIRSGKLGEDDPVELIEGLLVFKMPKNTPHSTCTLLARREVERALPAGWHYRAQEPVTLNDGEPEPDGAVVRGVIEDYADHHPRPSDVALLIEVADTSLERDRGLKLRSYARAGIPHYWILNLIDRQLEAYTDPDPAALPDPTYRGRAVIRVGADADVLVGGEAVRVSVSRLMPPE